jgi:hypothetical protein
MMRSVGSRERMGFFRLNMTAGPVQLKTPKDYFDACIVMPFWAAKADADEMLFLQHNQRNLDAIRKLREGVAWPVVEAELKSNHTEMDKIFSSPMSKFRYGLSAITIPSSIKAAGVCVRNEAQRRLTVTAIALERHKLRTGEYPPGLGALVPEFLVGVPLDPMNSKPLGYRRNMDGTFTLYSVGEDGRDDGGDATSGNATNKFDLWSGRDAVWPVAAGAED